MEVDKEDGGQHSEHKGDRGGVGRVLGDRAINMARPVMQVLDWQLREVIVAIDCNMKELVWLGSKMDGFTWEMKRMADQSNQKNKGKIQPVEAEDKEKKL